MQWVTPGPEYHIASPGGCGIRMDPTTQIERQIECLNIPDPYLHHTTSSIRGEVTTANIATTPKTQLHPPVGPSMDWLCLPWVTTANLSYRFPISETGIYIHIYMSYIIVYVIIQHVLHVVYQQIWETTVSPKNLGYVICDSLPFFVVSTEIFSQTVSRTLL